MALGLPAQDEVGLPRESRAQPRKPCRFEGWETKADLMAAVRPSAHPPTESVVDEWSRVLLRGEQDWPKEQPGSVVWYPPGSADAIAVASLIYQVTRDPKRIGWCLGWCGFPIADAHFWGALQEEANRSDRMIERFLRYLSDEANGEVSQKGLSLLSKARVMRTREQLFRQLRKRVGPELWNLFALRLIDVLKGEFEGWSPSADPNGRDGIEEREAMDRALGVQRQRRVAPVEDAPKPEDDVEQVFQLISDRIGGVKFAEVLASKTRAEIEQARDELRAIFILARAAPSTPIATKWAKRLSLKVLARYAARHQRRVQAPLLLMLLALKEDRQVQANLDQIIAAIRSQFVGSSTAADIAQARRIEPALVEFLVGK